MPEVYRNPLPNQPQDNFKTRFKNSFKIQPCPRATPCEGLVPNSWRGTPSSEGMEGAAAAAERGWGLGGLGVIRLPAAARTWRPGPPATEERGPGLKVEQTLNLHSLPTL